MSFLGTLWNVAQASAFGALEQAVNTVQEMPDFDNIFGDVSIEEQLEEFRDLLPPEVRDLLPPPDEPAPNAQISGPRSATLVEDLNLIASGKLTVIDDDRGEAWFRDELTEGAYGSLLVERDGNWLYGVGNAVQSLRAGESATDSFTVRTIDGTATTITMSLQGTNDVAQIGGADSGTVGVEPDQLVTGRLTIQDLDRDESRFVDDSYDGQYGTLALDPTGFWAYGVDTNSAAVKALKAGETLQDTVSIKSIDGTAHDIRITIEGPGAEYHQVMYFDFWYDAASNRALSQRYDFITSDIAYFENRSTANEPLILFGSEEWTRSYGVYIFTNDPDSSVGAYWDWFANIKDEPYTDDLEDAPYPVVENPADYVLNR